MKVSVCLCSYNGEKYIKEQLESIIKQAHKVDEIVICDDNSRDKTVLIAKEVLEESGIEHIISSNAENLGVTKNFEKACSIATGDIIFFSDQDDIWKETKVEKHLEVYNNKSNVNLVFSNAELFDDEGTHKETCFERFGFTQKKKKVFDKSQLRAILMGWLVTGATMSAKKNFIDKCMPFNDTLLHDQILSVIASTYGSLYFIDECLTRYRQHNAQVVGTRDLSLLEASRLVVDYKLEIKITDILLEAPINIGSIDMIRNKRYWLIKRSEIKEKSFFARQCKAVSFLLSGGYSEFSSNPIKSFLKDILGR